MLSDKPWKLEGILHLMVGIFVCLSCVVLVESAAQHFVGKEKFVEGSLLYLIFSSLSIHGSILLATFFYLRWHGVSWSEAFGFSTPPLGRAILLGVVVALAFLPVGMVLQEVSIRLLGWFHFHAPPQAAVDEFTKAASPASRAYLAFFAIFLAPVAEEILFRGILYSALKQIGYPRFALWGSAVAFAAIHLNAPIFLPLLVLGLALAWLYERTNNLLATITAHSLFNAINVALLYAGDYLEKMYNQRFHF